MNLSLKEITGFACSDPEIFITDKNGRGLYYFDNPNEKRITFNILKGKWRTNNKLEQLSKPLVYVCPPLPYKTVNRDRKEFKFRVGENKNKCTIDFRNPEFADVFIDHDINDQDIPHYVFVMFHEDGHFQYGGIGKDKETGDFKSKEEENKYYLYEHYCDQYAAKNMLERGFNPSQCYFAVQMSLSNNERGRERKQRIKKWLSQVKTK